MLVVRVTAIGGLIFVAVIAQAQFPIIPRKVYLKLESFAILEKVRQGHEGPAAVNLNAKVTHGSRSKSGWDKFVHWVDKNVWSKLDISGSRTLGFHEVKVSGDTTAYDLATNYGEGGQVFTNDGSTSIIGHKIFDVLSFQADLPDGRLSDPTTQNYLLEYDKGPWKISEGDIRGSLLPGNQLMLFSRALHGSMIEYQKGPWHFKGLYSETKGTAQTVSIPGSNSEGPYFLESGRVLPDTLSVMVDGVAQRPGVDFVLNSESADSGSITFLNHVIPPTSTIVATFESVSPGSSPGILAGVGGEYDMGKYGRFGVTLAEQLSTGQNGDGTVPDLFVFAGPSSPMYLLSYTPIPATVVVQINGQILQPGIWSNNTVVGGDYALNTADPQELFLNQGLNEPPNSTLYVKYQPVVTQTVAGDRQVYGLDYINHFGKNASIQYSQATGSTVGQSNGTGGTARIVSGTYLWHGINFTGNWKDIPDDFVAIETEGFNRNEKSYTLGADIKRGRFDYGLTYGNAMVDNQVLTGSGSGSAPSTFNSRSTAAKAFASYSAADGTTWMAAESRIAGHEQYNSTLDDTSVSATKSFGKKLKLDTGFDYQEGEGPLLNTQGDVVIGSVKLVTYHVGATYIPISKLTIDGKASVSDTEALGQPSRGNDLSLDATYRPSDKWSLSAKALNSSSGQSATLAGFTNTSGAGYGGNGFSSGPAGSGYLGAADGQLDTRGILIDYKASKRFSMNTHFSENYSTGSLTDNADISDVGVGAQWDLGQITILDFSIDQTNSRFVNSSTTGSAQDLSVSANLTASPKGSWFYQVGFNSLLPGGNSTFAQNSLSYNLGLGYRLSKKQQLSAAYLKSSTQGFEGQENDQLSLTYTYSIIQRLGLSLTYRVNTVSNTDTSDTTGSYRAAGFDLNLTYGFRS